MMRTALLERPHPNWDGVQKLYRFDNGYGASVIRAVGMSDPLFRAFAGTTGGSYGAESGLWELAVTRYHGPGDDDYHLCYDTPITSDVLGDLTEEDVDRILGEIETLPKREANPC